jgi:hypothetical protein
VAWVIHKAKQYTNPPPASVMRQNHHNSKWGGVYDTIWNNTMLYAINWSQILINKNTAYEEFDKVLLDKSSVRWRVHRQKHCRCKINRTYNRLDEHLAGLWTRYFCTKPDKMMSEWAMYCRRTNRLSELWVDGLDPGLRYIIHFNTNWFYSQLGPWISTNLHWWVSLWFSTIPIGPQIPYFPYTYRSRSPVGVLVNMDALGSLN